MAGGGRRLGRERPITGGPEEKKADRLQTYDPGRSSTLPLDVKMPHRIGSVIGPNLIPVGVPEALSGLGPDFFGECNGLGPVGAEVTRFLG
jgi:hypothetical protein